MLWKVGFLKLHVKEVVEPGFASGLSDYRAGASSCGEIMPISPPPQQLVHHLRSSLPEVGMR